MAQVLYRDTLDLASLGGLAALEGLPESWRRLAARRIEVRRVEDWSARLDSPPVPLTGPTTVGTAA